MKVFVDLTYIVSSSGEPVFQVQVFTTRGWTATMAKDIPSVWKKLKHYCRPEDKLFITAEGNGGDLCNCARADGFRASAIVCDTFRSVLTHKNRP